MINEAIWSCDWPDCGVFAGSAGVNGRIGGGLLVPVAAFCWLVIRPSLLSQALGSIKGCLPADMLPTVGDEVPGILRPEEDVLPVLSLRGTGVRVSMKAAIAAMVRPIISPVRIDENEPLLLLLLLDLEGEDRVVRLFAILHFFWSANPKQVKGVCNDLAGAVGQAQTSQFKGLVFYHNAFGVVP